MSYAVDVESVAGPSRTNIAVVEDEGGAGPLSLVDLLVSDSSDQTLKSKFSSPEISEYLAHVTSLPLQDILQEPANLASEASQLTNSLTSLCHNEYTTFLSLHHTSTKLSSTFSAFSESLSSLLTTSLPALDARARSFTSSTKDILASRRKATVVLEQQDALLDILEIPQLLETCIRNGYYQEAMDLSQHSSSLARRFSDSPVILDIQSEVQSGMEYMVIQLLTLLRQPAKLPTLFKATSFLRKMGILDEEELAMAFVTSRLDVLEGVLDGIEKARGDSDDVSRYVRKYIDAWREGVYDFHTQYRTIFLDRLHASDVEKSLHSELYFRLSQFTHHTLTLLLSTLSQKLPKIRDNSSLASINTQLIYCCNSFGRIGMDFEHLLPPLFERAILTNFEEGLRQATDVFKKAIEDAKRYKRELDKWLITPGAASSPPLQDQQKGSAYAPPTILMSYPTLALYLNGILTTLNNLRLLTIESFLPSLHPILDAQLSRSSEILFSFVHDQLDQLHKDKANSNPMRSNGDTYGADVDDAYGYVKMVEKKEAILKAAGRCFVDVLVPFVRRALIEGVYHEHIEALSMEKELEDNVMRWRELLGDNGIGSAGEES